MSTQENELIRNDVHAYLDQHQKKELLRFVTVGSVDDGKSTLIGRLLHDTHGVYEDQLKAVKRASTRAGLEIDFSLFTDGLKAEREQGITIDVAYRYFSTAKRKFIIADTPGHVQYTRNMATGASTANVAIILIDARLGVLQQSRRHAYIGSLLGIPQLTVCINKMDLEGYSEEVFNRIRKHFSDFAGPLGFKGITFIPVSALAGDNVVHRSEHTPWYQGPTLLEHLERVPVAEGMNFSDFRFPVQYVMRPDLDYRGFSGTIASGVVKPGDPVMVLPSGKTTTIVAVDTAEGEQERAYAPMSVTLRLAQEIDISRGDMLVHPHNLPTTSKRFDAMLVWMSERALDRQKSYLLKHTTQTVRAEVEQVEYTTDLETLKQQPATRLELNDIGRVTIACHRPLFYDAYKENRATGAFILIDSLTNNTVAAGMILEGDAAPEARASQRPPALSRAHSQVSHDERAERLGQKGCTVWLTGLPASGKSEIAFALERRLFDTHRLAMVVDPDDGISTGVQPDGSSPWQTPELARRSTDAGLIVVFAYASPLRADRETIRDVVGAERFVEVHVETSLAKRKERDARGVYGPGHVQPSEERPLTPDLTVSLDKGDAEEAAAAIVQVLVKRGLLPSQYAL
ncbi:MAG TPA: sulfate adenylyltransferase subunit CysN [Polyangiaceae bacterium]|nr:sulfate adenylyltransferase subunit CysN [Polyangiaceae bacterium]